MADAGPVPADEVHVTRLTCSDGWVGLEIESLDDGRDEAVAEQLSSEARGGDGILVVTGRSERKRTLRVTVPAGIDDGQAGGSQQQE